MRPTLIALLIISIWSLSACSAADTDNAEDINQPDVREGFDAHTEPRDITPTEDRASAEEAFEGYYKSCPCPEGDSGYQQYSVDHDIVDECVCGSLDDRELPDLSGRWAKYMVQTSSVKMPIFGDISDTEVRSLLLVEAEQNGTDLTFTMTACAIEMVSEDAIVETIMPDVFVASLETAIRPGLLIPNGDRISVHAPPFYELRGVELDNPEEDPLPTDPEDPAVIDQDNDGFPGMTIRLKGAISGDLYIVQRSWTQIHSTEIADDRISGHVVWGEEQNHLGSTNEVLRSVAVESWVKDDPSAHTFEMVRAPEASCESIVAAKSELFGL